jgi:small subunit ribosomal protein S20
VNEKMPNIKSAKKKLRQDKKRALRNVKYQNAVKKALKTAKKADTVYSLIDKAAKNKIIHKNKAARLKSRVGKLFAKAKVKVKAKAKAKSK